MASLQFLTKTAWLDSKKNRGKLAMFMSSIILGIAALVAINSFNDNLTKDIDKQAASLLGADLAVTGNRPAAENILASLDSLEAERASELDMLSMAYLPSSDESQFVRIKALEGAFPFYGEMDTEPKGVFRTLQTGNNALVDDGLMIQHGLNIGDSVKLGFSHFIITGRLLSVFGSNSMASGFAPTIYISKSEIPATRLIQPGSLVNYSYYAKLADNVDADQWKEERRESFRLENMRIETISDRKENLSQAFESLNYFLNLVALVSLLLGCLGVASSVFIYLKSKITSIATFRCLGMSGLQAFLIYFIQILILGLVSVVTGTILGSIIQVTLPFVLSDILPFEVSLSLSWRAIWQGLTIGLIITILFALIPLISVRKISPLRTLRASFDEDIKPKDPLKLLVFLGIVLTLFLFLWMLTGDWINGLVFTLGLLVSFLVLYLTSLLIIWSVKRFFPRNWSFVLRQGLSNLFRPNNQTQTLLVSIGIGTSVLTTLFIIQGILLQNVRQMDAGNQPNMILYGIETNQKDEIAGITESYDMPLLQQVPIVTMRIEGWKGKTKSEWLADTTRKARNWAIHRESRVTYRDTVDRTEELVRGEYIGRVDNPDDSILISLSDGYADAMDVDIGDQMVFNVQGTRIETYVSSIRKIDFRNMQARFFIVFPLGVLEEAPQFHVLVSKSPDNRTTAKYRSEIVKTFPNVSVVDLGTLLVALGKILDKVSYVIQFMAIFSILTGLIVLISSLLLSKYQRIKESVLLRTLGASKKQIFRINATEYTLLGALSAATGIVISIIGSYLLTKFQLEMDFSLRWFPILLVFLFVTGLTVLVGLLNSREVVNRAPLEVLRKEVG
jgi:putative ABC transport system permease protein